MSNFCTQSCRPLLIVGCETLKTLIFVLLITYMKLKQILITLVALLFVCFATVSEAQTLSKSEKKILKKELKTYKKNPEDYSSMK